MSIEGRTILLDVTRLISRSWTGRQSTGLDRVCYAYLRRYRHEALAVVQHRGLVRVLGPRRSEKLFAMLLRPAKGFRPRFVGFAPAALADPMPEAALAGLAYLNVSHTDFDLDAHFDWVERSRVRPFYFIHDLIPVLHPDLTRPRAVRRHRGRVVGALRKADGIIVSSHCVARDLASFARSESLAGPPILVAPIAGEGFALSQPVEAPQTPYFLTIGTIEPRKNHALLFEVWCELAARMGPATPKLVVVGQEGPLTGEILAPVRNDAPLAAHVDWRKRCSDGELAVLLAGAQALLMPSLAEGFGLPLVEALQAGVPAIASDTAIFREIGQGAAMFIDPTDRAGWASTIETLVNGERPALAPFAAPSWDDHFAALDSWLAQSRLKTGRDCESSLAA